MNGGDSAAVFIGLSPSLNGRVHGEADDAKSLSLGWLEEWWWPWPPQGNWEGNSVRGGSPWVHSAFAALCRRPVQMSGEPWEILPGTWVRMAPRTHEPIGSCQHCDRKSRRPSNRGLVKWTTAHPLCRSATKVLGETERRKRKVSLFTLHPSVLKVFDNEKTLVCSLYNYINDFNNNNNKEFEGEKTPRNINLGSHRHTGNSWSLEN